jgi:hypothetical protein
MSHLSAAWLLVVATACRAPAQTGPVDARATVDVIALDVQADARPDARVGCPPIGTPPRYSPLLYQDIIQNCSFFSTNVDGSFATAQCPQYGAVYEGTATGPLSTAAGIPASLAQARLLPEGDLLIAPQDNQTYLTFQRDNTAAVDSAWSQVANALLPPVNQLSTFSAAPKRHVLLLPPSSQSDSLLEMVENADGTWSLIHTYQYESDFGSRMYGPPFLSADGLRLVFAGQAGSVEHMMYTDRATIDGLFGPAVPLEGVPFVYDPFITTDCSRIYFSGLGSIYHLDQE